MRELHQVQDDSPERSILARLILSNQTVEADPLEELHGLATTAGTEVMDELVQRRPSPDHSTYLGKGKVEELRLMVERHDADLVIFDNDLSPAQTRNLEKSVGAKVLDRTELILDIFAAGARTYESRLAIELAQLEYSLPRLKRMWTHLSRQAMGVGMRGPGEKQLEVDRRLAQKRIHDLKQELSKVEQRRERQVKAARGPHGLSGRLHECWQEHADERTDRSRCPCRRQTFLRLWIRERVVGSYRAGARFFSAIPSASSVTCHTRWLPASNQHSKKRVRLNYCFTLPTPAALPSSIRSVRSTVS